MHTTIPLVWQLHHPDYGLCIPRQEKWPKIQNDTFSEFDQIYINIYVHSNYTDFTRSASCFLFSSGGISRSELDIRLAFYSAPNSTCDPFNPFGPELPDISFPLPGVRTVKKSSHCTSAPSSWVTYYMWPTKGYRFVARDLGFAKIQSMLRPGLSCSKTGSLLESASTCQVYMLQCCHLTRVQSKAFSRDSGDLTKILGSTCILSRE